MTFLLSAKSDKYPPKGRVMNWDMDASVLKSPILAAEPPRAKMYRDKKDRIPRLDEAHIIRATINTPTFPLKKL